MAVLRPRNRLVYFRVSEDEYQQFNQICETARARSVSDLARFAVQRMIHDSTGTQEGSGTHTPEDVVAKLRVLEAGIVDLSQRVQELTALVRDGRLRGVESGEGPELRACEE